MRCPCSTDFTVSLGRPDEYDRAKSMLNRGAHPGFIGRDTVTRCARNGGLLFFQHDAQDTTSSGTVTQDVAVAIINPHLSSLLALNTAPAHRGHGLGSAILSFIAPNWVRAIHTKVNWFEARGYVTLGEPKQGRAHQIHIMVRKELLTLAGRLQHLPTNCQCDAATYAKATAMHSPDDTTSSGTPAGRDTTETPTTRKRSTRRPHKNTASTPTTSRSKSKRRHRGVSDRNSTRLAPEATASNHSPRSMNKTATQQTSRPDT